MDADELYQSLILDHFRHPRHQRAPAADEVRAEGFNPACGDRILLAGTVEADRIAEVHHQVHGCALSVASASLLSEACRGLSQVEARALADRVTRMLAATEAGEPLPGDLAALASIRRYPMRHKCALLPWRALVDWLDKIQPA